MRGNASSEVWVILFPKINRLVSTYGCFQVNLFNWIITFNIHAINDNFQAILNLSHCSNTLILDSFWLSLLALLTIWWDYSVINEVKLVLMATFKTSSDFLGRMYSTCNLCLAEKYHISISPINPINKSPSSFRNVAGRTIFTSLIIAAFHTWETGN